jgi:hypothetical protein
MGWIITNNIIDCDEKQIKSDEKISFDSESKKLVRNDRKLKTFKFRMLDDDNEVYFEGYCTDNSSEYAFSPLDEFGMPCYGCTDIQYFENGRWESL